MIHTGNLVSGTSRSCLSNEAHGSSRFWDRIATLFTHKGPDFCWVPCVNAQHIVLKLHNRATYTLFTPFPSTNHSIQPPNISLLISPHHRSFKSSLICITTKMTEVAHTISSNSSSRLCVIGQTQARRRDKTEQNSTSQQEWAELGVNITNYACKPAKTNSWVHVLSFFPI